MGGEKGLLTLIPSPLRSRCNRCAVPPESPPMPRILPLLLLCASSDPDGDGLSNLDEFLAQTDPLRADTDGDGIADGAEVLAEANPLDADEDGDGVPDGISAEIWAANPLWATNAPDGAALITITLNDAISANESAGLLVADLCIPLREPADNFVSPDSYHNPNTQFTAPGFLYMENP